MMDIAVFGGTFDPVHQGHLIIAEQAYNSFDVKEIILIPAGSPPHKEKSKITSSNHRLNMLKLSTRDNPHFSISEWEINSSDKSYTVDTLKHFQQKYPDIDIHLIIGADSLYEIFEWKNPEYLLENSNLIVAPRPDYSIESILNDQRYRPYRENINLLDNCLFEISSTRVRNLYKDGKSIKYLVPDRVQDYIMKNKLY